MNEEYIEQYKQLIKEQPDYAKGWELEKHGTPSEIVRLVNETNSKTLLDFGCGQGAQYTEWKVHEKYGFPLPTLYDPAIEEYSHLPEEKFDGIISTDVMEHIPEESINSTLEYIFTHATKFVYIKLSTKIACTILPNGKNAHATVKPINWWVDKIKSSPHFPPYTVVVQDSRGGATWQVNGKHILRKV